MSHFPCRARAGFSLIEVVIALVVLITVMIMVTESLTSVTQHDRHSAARDDLAESGRRIAARVFAEIASSGWHVPQAAAPDESALDVVTGRLPETQAVDRQVRYWPYVMGERSSQQPNATSPFAYLRLLPEVAIDRFGLQAADIWERIQRFEGSTAAPPASPAENATWADTVSDPLTQVEDRDWWLGPSRGLAFLVTYQGEWSPNEADLAKPGLAFGDPMWDDLALWQSADNHDAIGVVPISAQEEVVPGTGTFAYRPGYTDTTPFGAVLESGYLEPDPASGSFLIRPQWDTIAAPGFEPPLDQDVWRDRVLVVVRSGSSLGRLVLAVRTPFTGQTPGTDPGARLSPVVNGACLVVSEIIAEDVIRLAVDTARTDDPPLAADRLGFNAVRVTAFLAREDRSQDSGVLTSRVTVIANMRAKDSAVLRVEDEALMTGGAGRIIVPIR